MAATSAPTSPADRLRAYAASLSPVPVADALSLFDALPPVTLEQTVGEWQGGVVPTGHRGEQPLKLLRWAGKNFRGPEDVDPIVSHAGGRRFANPVLGGARVRMTEHRGVVTATMVYDRHPILDHFRGVDELTLLGVMDYKRHRRPLVFFLERL